MEPEVEYPAEHAAWRAMIRAAYHGTDREFKHVGAKGLGVTKRWRERFSNFLHDLGPCPDGKSLGRKNPALPFSPENTAWL